MTHRSILAGPTPTVIIKAGGSVSIQGIEGERVSAESDDRGGVQIEKSKGKEKQIARARAAVGDHVFFDLRLKLPNWEDKTLPDEIIEVQLGGGGQVLVPFGSNVKVYTGKDIDVRAVRGLVDAYTGAKLRLREVYCLGNASAGETMDLDCQTMFAQNAEFTAGSNIRFHVHELTNARIRVKDLGGYWEAHIGQGEKSVYLKSGGDVTLVTDQQVEPLPPNYILGKIEKPAA